MTTISDTLRRPLVLSEKAHALKGNENKVIFEVATEATKNQIRVAVESAFKVKVLGVHTMIVRGKMRRMGRGHAKTQNWKKAIVTLKEGDTIEAFEGV